jgi:hypothetical protein
VAYLRTTTVVSIDTVLVPTTIPEPAPTARPLEVVAKPELVCRRIEAPDEEVVKPPVLTGLNARPEEDVIRPEVDGSRIDAPLEPVCKPPVDVGVNVKLVPVRVTPLEAV